MFRIVRFPHGKTTFRTAAQGKNRPHLLPGDHAGAPRNGGEGEMLHFLHRRETNHHWYYLSSLQPSSSSEIGDIFMCYFWYFLDKIWPVALAVVATQIFTQYLMETRKPKLEIIPEGIINSGWDYGDTRNSNHAFRLIVRQKKINFLQISRDSVLQCKLSLHSMMI